MNGSIPHGTCRRVPARRPTRCHGRASRRVALALLMTTVMVSAEAATPVPAPPPSDQQYLDWIDLQRSLAKATIGEWGDLDWRAKVLDGQAKNDLAKAAGDAKKITHARAELTTADELTAISRRGRAVYAARLAVLDRLSSEAALREVHAAGPSYLMVSQTIGEVTVRDILSSEKLQHDRPFRAGEVIETGRDSYAALLLLDGSWLTLGPETTLRAATAATRAGFELVKGRLYRKLSCISNGASRTCGSVFTAFGTTLGAGGTEYAVDMPRESPAIVTALGGDLTLSGATGSALTLHESDWVTLSPDGALGTPVSGNRNAFQRWWNYLPEAPGQ
jgi:hypothetical protein